MSGTALRRVLHAGTAFVLVLVPLSSWDVLRWLLAAASGGAALVEFVRFRSPSFRHWLAGRLPVYRPAEDRRPSGAMWLAVGYAIAAWFPPPAATAGILVGALADPAASLTGVSLGGRAGKTLAGSAGHFAVGCAALAALGQPVALMLAAGAVGTACERWSGPIDDNLLVPPAVAAIVAALA